MMTKNKTIYFGKGTNEYLLFFLIDDKMVKCMKTQGVPRFGLTKYWYDRPHAQLNLWWFGVGWSTRWTTFPKE